MLLRGSGARPLDLPQGRAFYSRDAFEMASTNLVLELGLIMLVLLGWQFTLAEFVGAPLMVVFLVLLFRIFLSPDLLEQAKNQADKGIAGRMEGHAEMDMSVTEGGSLWQRMTSDRGLTAISHYFVMDWAAVWLDILGGLLIAGALAAWVPNAFWQSFFLTGHPILARRLLVPSQRSAGNRGLHHLELHDLAEPCFSGSRRVSRVALPQDGRASDAAHDEQAGQRWTGPPLCSLKPTQVLIKTHVG